MHLATFSAFFPKNPSMNSESWQLYQTESEVLREYDLEQKSF